MKILHMEIYNCDQCAYSRWYNGQLDCNKTGRVLFYHDERREMLSAGVPVIGVDYIPEWCPLPDKGGGNE